jgi:hypothetical protein
MRSFVENEISQKSLACRPEGLRAAGTATTMTHNASIASPMNSKTSASTANLPQANRQIGWEAIDRLLIFGAWVRSGAQCSGNG